MFEERFSVLPSKNRHRINIMISALMIVIGLGSSLVIAFVVVEDQWIMVLGLMLALPGVVLLHRYPLLALFIWLLIAPFVAVSFSGSTRRIFWLVHRFLPVATLAIILISSAFKINQRKLPKLSKMEVVIVGYAAASLLSVIYLSDDVLATAYQLYDRVMVPIFLYFLVRLADPSEKDLQRLMPILLFIVVIQAMIGMISWIAPQALPGPWSTRAGTRTVGSLRSPGVYTTTMIFCAAFILHAYLNDKIRRLRTPYLLAVILAVFMVFLSFSRASWLGCLIVITGFTLLYPRFMIRAGLFATPFITIILGAGLLGSYSSLAERRLNSDQTALSRLPVVLASYRMFQAKPITGWGYGNFDQFDRQFQGRVGDLVAPEKDHASHNVYLTILAEQGLTGLLFFILPVLWWLALSVWAWFVMPAEGFWSRKLLVVLWLIIIDHVMVNNFANMRVVFGLGMWWITLALIGNSVRAALPGGSRVRADEENLEKQPVADSTPQLATELLYWRSMEDSR